MPDPILVTGGTGTLGRVLVQTLTESGLPTRVLTRRAESVFPAGVEKITGDLLSGAGLSEAAAGAGAIVHCATNYRRPSDDVHGTRRLVDAVSAQARERGSSTHLIYVSIVGADRIPLQMYHYKAGIEGMIQRSGLPCTIQRFTQFHDLIRTMLKYAGFLPIMPLPAGLSFQPVDTLDVARQLATLTVAEPVGRAPDFGGPEVRTIQDLARSYLLTVGQQRRLVPVRVPGKVFAGYRDGWNLAPANPGGTITFEQFLLRNRTG